MAITNAHLHWFKLKCPYPQGSKAFRMAKAKLGNVTYADLERLRAEFEMYKNGSSPVTHYHLYDEWFASVGGCLLYTSPSPRDRQKSRMPSSA